MADDGRVARLPGRAPGASLRGQPGRVGDADDGALAREQTGHGLAPGLGARPMQELEPPVLQLLSRRGDGGGVGDLELEADLRYRAIRRPLVGPEAGTRRLVQRPDGEVLGASDLLAVEVVVVGRALQR